MIYNEIYSFCKVKNKGNVFTNTSEMPTPRVQFIIELLEQEEIPYDLNMFSIPRSSDAEPLFGWNVILMGTSDKMVVAHHDIVNPESDNANDNSCSVINAIALKKLMPELNVVLLDGEEFGGIGSTHLSNQINEGFFNDIAWVLNLELTGRGGRSFFVDTSPFGPLMAKIYDVFPDTPYMAVPFNDSMIFRRHGIDSVNINPLPLKEDESMDTSILWLCHSMNDSVDKISPIDMKEFVEEVLVPICSEG